MGFPRDEDPVDFVVADVVLLDNDAAGGVHRNAAPVAPDNVLRNGGILDVAERDAHAPIFVYNAPANRHVGAAADLDPVAEAAGHFEALDANVVDVAELDDRALEPRGFDVAEVVFLPREQEDLESPAVRLDGPLARPIDELGPVLQEVLVVVRQPRGGLLIGQGEPAGLHVQRAQGDGVE